MEKATEFPKFECMISNTKEEYDSEVEGFFTLLTSLEAEIGLLMLKDASWKEKYAKILGYLSDMETAIIFKRGTPDFDFMGELLTVEDPQDEVADILRRSKDEVPAILLGVQSKTRDLMSAFVAMSRIPRFSEGFTRERFEGLLSLRKVLFRRAVQKSEQ